MMNESEYKIFTIGDKDYFFTSAGFSTMSFHEMSLKRFSNDQILFHFLFLNDNLIVMFGTGESFVDFLESQGVSVTNYHIESFEAKEEFKDFEVLNAQLNDGYNLKMSASYLDYKFTGYLSNEIKKEFTHLQFGASVRLSQVTSSLARLKVQGIMNDENHVKYLEEKEKQKADDQLIKTFAYVAGAALFIYFIYSFFKAL